MNNHYLTTRTFLLVSSIMCGVLFTLWSSKNDNPVINNPAFYWYTNNTNIMKDTIISYIHEPALQSDSLLVLKPNVPELGIPKIGSVLYVPISQISPQGFMGKVVSVRRDSLIYVTVQYKPVGASIADSGGKLDDYVQSK